MLGEHPPKIQVIALLSLEDMAPYEELRPELSFSVKEDMSVSITTGHLQKCLQFRSSNSRIERFKVRGNVR